MQDDWPESLKQFSLDCKRFTLPVLTSKEPLYKPSDLSSLLQAIPREIWRGMSPKKKDEVEIMSEFVHQECKRLSIGKILDLGSGLGYIDRLLLLRGYRILGIESQTKLVAFSIMQKENFFPPCLARNLDYHNMRICGSLISEVKNAVVNILCKPSGDSLCTSRKVNNNVNKYDWDRLIPLCRDMADNTNSDKICMIGLHSCGDLAVTGIKMFMSLAEVSALVLIPCCYHKMSLRHNCRSQVESEFALEEALCDTDTESGEETFHHFPLSRALISQSVGAKFVCRPFLRLANQATNTSWQGWTEGDHHRHAFNVLSRAVIELVAQQQGATFKKCFRRVVRKTSLKGKDFLSYVEESLSRCEFINQKQSSTFEQNKNNIRNSLLETWEQHKDKSRLVEAVTGLQMCLEPVAESLVVADRACYLWEGGRSDVRVVRMIDNKLSPRCLAYVASKV
ncbi:hypothetical protein J6590_025193 [Homalodisca vitripennis]|nr:hypothetical protein J6590_025193 [Homalodisca vitripennis]